MRWMMQLALVALTILVTGCENGLGFSLSDPAPGVSAEDARASRCAGWRVIEPTATDVEAISDQLAAGVLTHNLHGVEQGCWDAR